MICRPGPNCIELDGEGAGVPMTEIRRASELFVQLFGVEPQLRITGIFGPDALGYVPGADPNMSTWDLRQVFGSGYGPILSVGHEHLRVQAHSGLNNNRSIAVAPDRGAMVKVRLSLPKP